MYCYTNFLFDEYFIIEDTRRTASRNFFYRLYLNHCAPVLFRYCFVVNDSVLNYFSYTAIKIC